MKRVALIPARGGSKRLLNKNIIKFLGIPIISFTIKEAIKTKIFERVVVSTDDKKIADISFKHGAEISWRNPNLATDTARVVEVCKDFIKNEEENGRNYEIICCLYPTAPLRNAFDIESTISLLQPEICEFSMAVTEYHLPPNQAMQISKTGYLKAAWPDLVGKRYGEEVGKYFVDNGSTYAAYVESFKIVGHFRGPKLKGYLMPMLRSIDINTKDDLRLAKIYAEFISNKKSGK